MAPNAKREVRCGAWGALEMREIAAEPLKKLRYGHEEE
jgi:hypothetical protein